MEGPSEIDKEHLLDLIRQAFEIAGGAWVSQKQFLAEFDLDRLDIFPRHFPNWREAVVAAGVEVGPGTPGPRCESCDTTGYNYGYLANEVEQRHESRFNGAWLCDSCYSGYLEEEKIDTGMDEPDEYGEGRVED
jgi:hypothetical protein